jgi:hypothetical protein
MEGMCGYLNACQFPGIVAIPLASKSEVAVQTSTENRSWENFKTDRGEKIMAA